MFLEMAFDPNTRLLYICWVTTLVASITLHELAHGWAALWQGDDTPRVSGHMTPNPLVHMGPMSLVLLFLVGLAWGAMPVNPAKFRSRYGDALVALAGPAMNVLLAVVALVALGLWLRQAGTISDGPAGNWQEFLWAFGYINIGLAIFNLGPLPPLDGSRIAANFSTGYRVWLSRLSNPMAPLLIYFFAMIALSWTGYGLWMWSRTISVQIMGWLQ
jgi:Zn-dependent protease